MSWTTLAVEHQRSHLRRAVARKGMQIFSSCLSTDDRCHRPLAKSNHSMPHKLRPSFQPSSASPCMNVAPKDFLIGSVWSKAQRKLIRRTQSACCARAANGHAAAQNIAHRGMVVRGLEQGKRGQVRRCRAKLRPRLWRWRRVSYSRMIARTSSLIVSARNPVLR